jgi:hypothetical protein
VTTTQERITPSDLGKIGRKTKKILCELANSHGVKMRVTHDGNHVLLYNGDTQERPYKISSSRPEETTLTYLKRWIADNVPDYDKPKPKPAPTPLVMTSEKKETSMPALAAVPQDSSPWKPYKYGFETDGTTYRCATQGCDFSKESTHALHLHAVTHADDLHERRSAATAKALETKAEKRQEVADALRLLARHLKIDMGDTEALKQRVVELEQENADLKARLDLLREALRA